MYHFFVLHKLHVEGVKCLLLSTSISKNLVQKESLTEVGTLQKMLAYTTVTLQKMLAYTTVTMQKMLAYTTVTLQKMLAYTTVTKSSSFD